MELPKTTGATEGGTRKVDLGTMEIHVGLYYVWLGLFILVVKIAAVFSAIPLPLAELGVHVWIIVWGFPGILLIRWIMRRLQSRWITPRLIPIAPPARAKITIQKVAVLAVAVFAGIILLSTLAASIEVFYPEMMEHMPILVMAAIGGIYYFFRAWQLRQRRFLALATFSLCLGGGCFLYPNSLFVCYVAYFILFGMAMTACGGLALRAFVRDYRIVEPPA